MPSHAWPPPPDLPSLQELVRTADTESLIADGAPADEYDPEAQTLFEAIRHLPTRQLLTATLLPILEPIWTRSFNLDPEALAARRPHLLSLAKEIERFFGPESRPRTRAQILSDNATGTPAG